MNHTLRNYFLLVIITLSPLPSLAQVADSTAIKGQFEYLFNKSNTFDQHKVISINGYNTLKRNATDSIQLYKKVATQHFNERNSLNLKLEASNQEISQLKEELVSTQNLQDSVLLLGMAVSKKTYSLIMWGIILSLALTSVILFLLYKQGHQVVKESRARLQEVQEDFEKHRKNAIAREQALGQEFTIYKLKHKQ